MRFRSRACQPICVSHPIGTPDLTPLCHADTGQHTANYSATSSCALADIPDRITTIPSVLSAGPGGSQLLTHDLFTNDVLYLDVALDMKAVPADLLPLVPLFCQ